MNPAAQTLVVWTAVLFALASLGPHALTLAHRLRPPDIPAPAIQADPASEERTSALGVILDAAPFGRAEGADMTATPATPVVELTLVGVTVAAIPTASRALIAGGPAGGQTSLTLGDVVAEGMVLSEIQPDGVVLQTDDGRQIRLGFPESPSEGIGARTGAGTPAGVIDFSGASTQEAAAATPTASGGAGP